MYGGTEPSETKPSLARRKGAKRDAGSEKLAQTFNKEELRERYFDSRRRRLRRRAPPMRIVIIIFSSSLQSHCHPLPLPPSSSLPLPRVARTKKGQGESVKRAGRLHQHHSIISERRRHILLGAPNDEAFGEN